MWQFMELTATVADVLNQLSVGTDQMIYPFPGFG
jgi:hypothetical protein